MRLRRNGDSVLAAELGRYTATTIIVTLRYFSSIPVVLASVNRDVPRQETNWNG
jgi:hypothetical protein